MNEKLTEIVILLDRSGSMEIIKTPMESALEEFINAQKKVEGDANITLVQFNDKCEFIHEACPIDLIKDIKIKPRNTTALLDALGITIKSVGERLSNMKEKKRPGKVIFCIITDGYENASKEYKRSQIFDMITEQRDKYNWQFTYLGANQDSIQEAASFGIPCCSAINYSGNKEGTSGVIASMSNAVSGYRSGSCSSYPIQYTEEDRNVSMSSD